jgi:hypothetical protein
VDPRGNTGDAHEERSDRLVRDGLRRVSSDEARAEEAWVIERRRHLWPHDGAASRDHAKLEVWAGERSELCSELSRLHQCFDEDVHSDHRGGSNLCAACLAIGPTLVRVGRRRARTARSGGDTRWLSSEVLDHRVGKAGGACRRFDVAPLLANHVLRQGFPFFERREYRIFDFVGEVELADMAKHHCR